MTHFCHTCDKDVSGKSYKCAKAGHNLQTLGTRGLKASEFLSVLNEMVSGAVADANRRINKK